MKQEGTKLGPVAMGKGVVGSSPGGGRIGDANATDIFIPFPDPISWHWSTQTCVIYLTSAVLPLGKG